MKEHDWKYTLKELTIHELEDFQPFKYVYAVSQTEKAILFKLKNHLTSFVPKSQLRFDRYGVSGQKAGWIWLKKSWVDQIIKEHADQSVEI